MGVSWENARLCRSQGPIHIYTVGVKPIPNRRVDREARYIWLGLCTHAQHDICNSHRVFMADDLIICIMLASALINTDNCILLHITFSLKLDRLWVSRYFFDVLFGKGKVRVRLSTSGYYRRFNECYLLINQFISALTLLIYI